MLRPIRNDIQSVRAVSKTATSGLKRMILRLMSETSLFPYAARRSASSVTSRERFMMRSASWARYRSKAAFLTGGCGLTPFPSFASTKYANSTFIWPRFLFIRFTIVALAGCVRASLSRSFASRLKTSIHCSFGRSSGYLRYLLLRLFSSYAPRMISWAATDRSNAPLCILNTMAKSRLMINTTQANRAAFTLNRDSSFMSASLVGDRHRGGGHRFHARNVEQVQKIRDFFLISQPVLDGPSGLFFEVENQALSEPQVEIEIRQVEGGVSEVASRNRTGVFRTVRDVILRFYQSAEQLLHGLWARFHKFTARNNVPRYLIDDFVLKHKGLFRELHFLP